jgi:hypothetical protein
VKKVLFASILSIIFIVLSCQKETVSTDETSIVGTYKTVINPILCSFPTMSDLSIKSKGETYNLTFKHTNTGSNEELSGVSIIKTDSTATLMRKGVELGKYFRMKYLDLSDGGAETVESMVLMLRFESDNKHYEFMGRK